MRCQMLKLMMLCVVSSLASCQHAVPVDSFCQVYNQVVVQKGDGTITASPNVKRRLLANEMTYRQLCTKVSQ
jgi:hypothetical protein